MIDWEYSDCTRSNCQWFGEKFGKFLKISGIFPTGTKRPDIWVSFVHFVSLVFEASRLFFAANLDRGNQGLVAESQRRHDFVQAVDKLGERRCLV